MPRHAWVTTLTSLAISVTLLGAGIATVMAIPTLSTASLLVLPVIVLLGLLLAPFAAERISPRLSPGEHHEEADGLSSGRTYPRGG